MKEGGAAAAGGAERDGEEGFLSDFDANKSTERVTIKQQSFQG